LFQFGKGGSFGLSGNIFTYQSATGVGNGADTTEDTLQSFTLPANAFDLPGRALWIYAYGKFATDLDSKTARLYFGSSIVLSSGAQTLSNTGWALELLVQKTGANAQIASGQIVNGTTHGGVTLPLIGTETDTAGIIIKVTGQTGTAAANDVVLNGLMIAASN
ncbi:MAG: hypothetical protein KGL35_03290, partial [Bradyrhizobium sp.]|nr:hypothetical protein [Bradyrhizobium sp.]